VHAGHIAKQIVGGLGALIAGALCGVAQDSADALGDAIVIVDGRRSRTTKPSGFVRTSAAKPQHRKDEDYRKS